MIKCRSVKIKRTIDKAIVLFDHRSHPFAFINHPMAWAMDL